MVNNLKSFCRRVFSRRRSLQDYFFALERFVVRRYYLFFGCRPSSKPFLSGDTFASFATAHFTGHSLSILKPEIIFTTSSLLEAFKDNLHFVKHPFILISHHGDELVDESYLSIASSEYLIHWYAQNCVIRHRKVTPIPIGLEDRWRHTHGIIRDFQKIRREPVPVSRKLPRILYAFSINTNPKERQAAFQALQSNKHADHYSGNTRAYKSILAN